MLSSICGRHVCHVYVYCLASEIIWFQLSGICEDASVMRAILSLNQLSRKYSRSAPVPPPPPFAFSTSYYRHRRGHCLALLVSPTLPCRACDRHKYKPFNELLAGHVRQKESRGLALESFLIKPVQRLTKYPLLLQASSPTLVHCSDRLVHPPQPTALSPRLTKAVID